MKKKKKENGSSFEEGMLKLLRTLPKVLKFLPSDKAKDARNFMMSFQYWLGGKKHTSDRNSPPLSKRKYPRASHHQTSF